MSAKASGADPTPNGSANNRSHTPGNQSRSFTPEQKAAVIRVRKCAHTAFYEILAIEKSATESEVKKAYRKLSLLTHPDKNGYDGADEAFKMVSRAFQVLSDADKKAKFDRFGGDPDSRFGAGGGGPSAGDPFEGFARRGTAGAAGRGPMFEEEISPEELFQRFFGGGAFGGGFGPFGGRQFGGEQFVFNMGGGPGFRVHQFGGGRPRRRPRDGNAQEPEQSPLGVLQNLLPLIILFAVTIFSSLFSGMGDSAPRIPEYRFETTPPYTEMHNMPTLKTGKQPVKFYVDPRAVDKYTRHDLKRMEQNVEHQYTSFLNSQCIRERNTRQRQVEDAQGWGIFPDTERIQRILAQPMYHCERINELGLRVSYGY